MCDERRFKQAKYPNSEDLDAELPSWGCLQVLIGGERQVLLVTGGTGEVGNESRGSMSMCGL